MAEGSFLPMDQPALQSALRIHSEEIGAQAPILKNALVSMEIKPKEKLVWFAFI